MKAVILNGMEAGDAWTAAIQDELVAALEERAWDVDPLVLHAIDVKPCGGCFGCWLQTPGRCVMHDTDDVAAAVVQSDLMIWLTPVRFGGYASHLKKVLDHLICLILPFFKTVDGETHHVPRYEEPADLLVVGTLPQADAESEAIFADLAERNAINMSASRWAAGVVVEERGLDVAHERVQDLLTDVEVMG